MNSSDKNIVVIGGGAAGLTTALELAQFDIPVELVETAPFLGGHAVQYACKATESCVKCGACMVEEKLRRVVENPLIKILTASRVKGITGNGRWEVAIEQDVRCIDAEKCTACGVCLERCPEAGAIVKGSSAGHHPLYAIAPERCRYYRDHSCTLCQEACPEEAITLDAPGAALASRADAVVVATGFKPFEPDQKPYGYGRFANVVTNLELDRMLWQESIARRPSDSAPPQRIAFIQCVGSRDAKLNHLWCSKVCCGVALRAANLIKMRAPETEVTLFYIDIQTFGRDFQAVYAESRRKIEMIRAIPGDIFQNEDQGLQVTFFDPQTGTSREEDYDLVVLSVGITPPDNVKQLAEQLNLELNESGFLAASAKGIFCTGSATGPMSIAESIGHASATAGNVMRYLGR